MALPHDPVNDGGNPMFLGLEPTPASQALLARIVELADDAIVSTDAQQRIILFNRGAEKVFGYSSRDVLGQPLDVLLPKRFRASHRHQVDRFGAGEIVSRRMGERAEVLGLRSDGVEFPAEASISKQDVDGTAIYTVVVRDISERKRIEQEIRQLNQLLEQRVQERTLELQSKTEESRELTQQLWQAAKLASVGEVAAGIAHELNNPMATVVLRLEAVLAKTPTDDSRRKGLEIIEQEVKRMSGLVANLLQFSRRSRDEYSRFDVREELDRSVELVQYLLRKSHIQLQQSYDPTTPWLVADRQKIRQVLLNLMTNAADAMTQGGVLTLATEAATLDDGRPAVAFEVVDTGIGISEENLPHVFEPFFTTKNEGKGTGLGLPICKRIVDEHHGTMSLVSRAGRGTSVRVVLPAGTGRHANAASADAESRPR